MQKIILEEFKTVGDEKTICISLEKIMKLDPYIND
jgi:hypothetical protein